MQYTKLGRTGLDVSRICLGCMSYGVPDAAATPGRSARRRAGRSSSSALDLGINFFDTANVYSDGTSEEIVGRALLDFARARRDRDRDQGARPDAQGPERRRPVAQGDPGRDRRQPEAARHRLRRPVPDPSLGLRRRRSRRRSKRCTTSSAPARRATSARRRCTRGSSRRRCTSPSAHGWTRFVERCRTTSTCSTARRSARCCRSAGRGHRRHPVEPARARPPDARLGRGERALRDRRVRPLALREDRRRRPQGRRGASPRSRPRRGVPRAQVALAWLLAKRAVTAPIVGATKLEHLDDAVAALDAQADAGGDRRRSRRRTCRIAVVGHE